MAYVGFDNLVKKLLSEGKSESAAKGIAASAGRKKYGAANFQRHAARGMSFRPKR